MTSSSSVNEEMKSSGKTLEPSNRYIKVRNKLNNSQKVEKGSEQNLPSLPSTCARSQSPKPTVERSVVSSRTPASPPTSNVITLEKILFGENPKDVNADLVEFLNHDKTKLSMKANGPIKAYAANTNQGILRDYNEDRVSIILNITKPKSKEHVASWPKVSFFGIFDGHGGASCADFLRDSLHIFIIRDEAFPDDPHKAIANGFDQAE